MNMQRILSAALAALVVVGSWKGYVAVFREGESEPWQIYPTKVTSLPVSDQEALAQGIPVRNRRDLEQLLEDYLS